MSVCIFQLSQEKQGKQEKQEKQLFNESRHRFMFFLQLIILSMKYDLYLSANKQCLDLSFDY
jgi:hypothetical protein